MLRKRSVAAVFFAVLVWSILVAFPANASPRKSEIYKSDLSGLTAMETPRLDWRNPEFDLLFAIPTNDWVDQVELFLNVQAEGRPDRRAPIYVQFNGAKPVPVYPQGNSFEARINLDRSKVRPHRNMIRISYAKTDGCIGPGDGAWTIDLKDSLIVVKATSPSQPYSFQDAKEILGSPLTAPKTVSIIAKGEQKYKLEALAAQGIALNLEDLPRYALNSGTGDMEIFAGTRAQLSSVIRGTALAKTKGKGLGITRNSPLRLVLTGDTEADVMDVVKAFAKSELPPSRRSVASGGELAWQMSFSALNKPVEGSRSVSDLGTLRFNRGWGNGAQSVRFDVDNPLAASGNAKFYFNRGDNVAKDSIVNVMLNGTDLGTIDLKHKKNVADFDIPRGLLVGTDNKLSIRPDLTPADPEQHCLSDFRPVFNMEVRSAVTVKSAETGFKGDLTRLAAEGYPFSEDSGDGTTVVMGTYGNADRAAGLRVLARLAKSTGTGWIDADFVPMSQFSSTDNNVLFIGPKIDAGAPRRLTAAVTGRLSEPKIIKTASLGPVQHHLYSVRSAPTGGVAAIMESDSSDALRGYITVSKGQSFTRLAEKLVETEHWNKLQGSMAKWDDRRVEMIKTAFQPVAAKPAKPSVSAGFSLPKFKLPEFNLPKPKPADPAEPVAVAESTEPVTPRVSSAEKIELAGQNAMANLSLGWDTLTQSVSDKFKRAPKAAPKVEPKAEPAPIAVAEVPKTPAPKQQAAVYKPVLAPKPVLTRPEVKAAPKIALKPAPSRDNGLAMLVELPQYDPGASFRKTVAAPKIIVKEPAAKKPAQYVPGETFKSSELPKPSVKENASLGLAKISDKVSAMMGRSQNDPLNPEAPAGRANMLLIALAMMLLLLLISLARPAKD